MGSASPPRAAAGAEPWPGRAGGGLGGGGGGVLRGEQRCGNALQLSGAAKTAPEEISWVCGIILIKIIDSYCTCESAGKGCLPK